MAEPIVVDPSSLKPRLEQAFDFAARQVRSTVERYSDFFPIYTAGGRWFHRGELWTDWCGGFHAGMMWLIAGRTGEDWWRRTAEHYSRLLEHRQHDRNVHDMGFIFLNTYLPWYRSTGDDRLRQVLITAGQTLALRFNSRGKYLRSFVAPESLFIDIMMNVPLIFHAARETGDQALHDLAVSHCRTTERTLVHADGCTDRYLAWERPGMGGRREARRLPFPQEIGVDESVMWGDFFFLEAVDKALWRQPETPGSMIKARRMSGELPALDLETW